MVRLLRERWRTGSTGSEDFPQKVRIAMRLLTTSEGLPRISWGAVIAGVILSLIVYLTLSVLGTAVGASLLRPLSHPVPLREFGFGSGFWVIVTTVVAVFTGAYFAGRCA